MGRRGHNRGRQVNGILVLDKAQGATSNAALQQVKRLFGAAKAGHTGSLDPLASGVLPLCFGEATKFSQYLLNADKAYRVGIQLGARTTTGDADGEILEEFAPVQLSADAVEAVLESFRGEIEQVPSMYSALKHQGTPLYKLARQGIEVERKQRSVHVHALDLLGFSDTELQLAVCCSKGTYVRSLAEDIGRALGTGGYVTSLRRTAAGPYGLEGAWTLEQLFEVRDGGGHRALDALLLPLSSSVRDYPEVQLNGATAFYLKQGQPVMAAHLPAAGWVRLQEGDQFIGVGEVLDDGRVAPRRLVAG
ncbi:MAG: tRNA pseudouridine(55) synthase TruB [Pseudomonadota bacterium]|nr:tRNA pseudouridine(55) synthase TruB [Pseudomonadota bacterium]